MCDICQLVSDDDDIQNGLMFTSQVPCPRGKALAKKHGIIVHLIVPALLETQSAPWVVLDEEEEGSSTKY